MKLRRDALCAAAEFVLAVEALGRRLQGLVATVGQLQTIPGVSNAIPGNVCLSLDLRHANDRARRAASKQLRNQARAIAAKRKLKLDWSMVSETAAVKCDKRLSALLNASVKRHQRRSMLLTSGAGHDAAVMAAITPVSMLFVRCKAGISHHPDESAREQDIRVAIAVMLDFIQSHASNA
jgi:allantoate deiminase